MPGKKPKKSDPPPADSSRLIRRLIAVALTLATVGGLVWGIARLGDEARRGIGPRDRYAVRFDDVECDPPPGRDRAAFLSEVRYLSKCPASFQSLDPELTAKFTAAFTAHPWVAGLDGVSVEPDGRVRVKVRFRVPVLVVKVPGGVRAVDAAGVLLPSEAATAGLPELVGVASPVPADGKEWADANVARALELVAAHHPRALEKTPQGWRLTTPDGKTLVVEK